MKGGIAAHIIANKIYEKPVKRNVFKLHKPSGLEVEMDGHGKEGQTFDVDRLARLCNELNVDPCRVAAIGLSDRVEMSDKDRIALALSLMEYLVPKRRSVESKVDLDASVTIEVVKDYGD